MTHRPTNRACNSDSENTSLGHAQAQPQYGVVFVTAASEAEAQAIAHHLLTVHLAACVSIIPIQSIYTWQGEICHQQEWQLVIKTDLTRFASLEEAVRALHSYEVPEIIALPMVIGSQPYLDWISEQVH